MESLEAFDEFIKGVKGELEDGYIRGEAVSEKVLDNMYLEMSVGSFEYGRIHIRLILEDEDFPREDGIPYNRLYKREGEEYEELHETLREYISERNDTNITNALVLESKAPPRNDAPSIPEEFDSLNTIFFDEFVQLRDDVTVKEAIESNRTESKY